MTEEELLKLKADLEAKELALKVEKEALLNENNEKEKALLEAQKQLSEKDEEVRLAKELAEKAEKDRLALEELAKSKDSSFEGELAKLKAQSDKNDLLAKIAELEKKDLEYKAQIEAKEKEKELALLNERAEKEKALFEAEKNRIMAEKHDNKFLVEAVKTAETLSQLELALKTLDKPELVKASKEDEEAGSNVLNGFKPTNGAKKTFLDELNDKLTNKQIRF